MSCINCGNESGILAKVKLCDGNSVCQECCQSVIERNGKIKLKQKEFQKQLGVINSEEFKKMYENPELAKKCDTEELLLVSPFRKENAKHEFYFLRKKLWLSYVKKKIETTVLVYDEGLDITEVTSTVKIEVKNCFLPIENIQEYKSRINLVKFPLVLLGILLVFYKIDIWSILLSLLLLWWSYESEIVLKTLEGNVYKIPVNNKCNEIEQLFEIIKENQQQRMEQSGQEKSCKGCGNKLQDSWYACPNCGLSVEKNIKREKERSKIKQWMVIVPIVIILFGVVLGIIGNAGRNIAAEKLVQNGSYGIYETVTIKDVLEHNWDGGHWDSFMVEDGDSEIQIVEYAKDEERNTLIQFEVTEDNTEFNLVHFKIDGIAYGYSDAYVEVDKLFLN